MNALYNYLNAQNSLYTPDNLKRFYNVCIRMSKDMNERYDTEGPSPDLCNILKSLSIQFTVLQSFYPDKNLRGEISRLNQRANSLSPPPQQPPIQQQPYHQPSQQQPQQPYQPPQQPPIQQPSQQPYQQPQYAIPNTLTQPPSQQYCISPPPQQQPIYTLPINNTSSSISMPLPSSMRMKGNKCIPDIDDIGNASCNITVPSRLPENDGSKPLSYDLLQYIDCFNSNIRSIIDSHLRAAIYFDISKDEHIDEYKKYVNCSLLSYQYLVDVLYDNRNNIKTLISSIYYPSLKRISILEGLNK